MLGTDIFDKYNSKEVLHASIVVVDYAFSHYVHCFNNGNQDDAYNNRQLTRLLNDLHGHPKQQLVLHGLDVSMLSMRPTRLFEGFEDLVSKCVQVFFSNVVTPFPNTVASAGGVPQQPVDVAGCQRRTHPPIND